MLDDAVTGHERARPTGPDQSAREIRHITAAVVVSALGTWSYNVAIAVYAFQATGSTFWVAAATVGRYLPALVIASWGTRLTARLPRRPVAIGCDVISAVTMALLTLIVATGGSLVLAIALAALSSGVARVQSATTLSLAADVVVESEMVKRMAFIGTSEAVATAVGPALASAALLVADAQWLFLLNAVSFFASAVLLLGVRDRKRRSSTGAAAVPAASRSSRATVRTTVWPVLALRTLVAFVYGADIVLLAVVATENLRSETTGYGWLLAAAGAGGLLVALRLSRWQGGTRLRSLASAGVLLYSLPLAVFIAAPGLVPSLATQIVRGAGMVLVVTLVIAALQRAVPSDLSAEVFGQTHSLVLIGTVAGSVAAPVLLSAIGLEATLAVVAVLPALLLLPLQRPLLRFDGMAELTTAMLDPVVSTLRRLALFQSASRWTLIELADRLEAIGVEKGRPVVVEGEPADALYVLVEGDVEVTQDGPGGPTVLRTLSAPAYFGEIGILARGPRTATVTTTTKATLWRISADDFYSAASQAGISSALSETSRLRLRNTPGSEPALEV